MTCTCDNCGRTGEPQEFYPEGGGYLRCPDCGSEDVAEERRERASCPPVSSPTSPEECPLPYAETMALLDDPFYQWRHTAHGKDVSDRFVSLACQMKKRGFKNYSAQAIFERLRWHHHMVHGPDGDGFKISHRWRSALQDYAVEVKPELRGFFRRRKKEVQGGERQPS